MLDPFHFDNIDAQSYDHDYATLQKMLRSARHNGSQVFRFEQLESIPDFTHGIAGRQPEGSAEQAVHGFLAAETGVHPNAIVLLRQVHSDIVLRVDEQLELSRHQEEPVRLGVGDAVVCTRPGLFPAIRTADCLPVLAVEPSRRVLALIHSGWRGTCARVVEKGLRALLSETGVRRERVLVGIGPGIRACCYEVGPDVFEQFAAAGHDLSAIQQGRLLDLAAAVRFQIRAVGIDQVFDCGRCTCCESAAFPSFRRDQSTERIWTYAGFLNPGQELGAE